MLDTGYWISRNAPAVRSGNIQHPVSRITLANDKALIDDKAKNGLYFYSARDNPHPCPMDKSTFVGAGFILAESLRY